MNLYVVVRDDGCGLVGFANIPMANYPPKFKAKKHFKQWLLYTTEKEAKGALKDCSERGWICKVNEILLKELS